MKGQRIYGEAVHIDPEHVRAFYQGRAAMGSDSAVLLGRPEAAAEKNAFEREEVLPQLSLTRKTRLLDIGCGIGRLAEMVLPRCGFYCGIDFSTAMIAATEKEAGFFGGKFDCVLIPGVCVYINDEDLARAFQGLPHLLRDTCAIYLTEPVGLEKRLSLVDYPSQALHSDYSAIYRTAEEYLALCAPLLAAGFSVAEQRIWPRFGETYTDTGRWHIILKRRGAQREHP